MEEEKIEELVEDENVNVNNVLEEKVVELEKEKNNLDEEKEKREKKKKRQKRRRLITDIIITILFLIIIFEIIVGMINMQKMHNHEKPVWYLDQSTEKYDDKIETIYNLGLYRIVESKYLVQTDDGPKVKETQIFLKPFFYK